MSQAKVDRYKEEKKNRKKIMAKEKRMRIAGYVAGCLVAAGIIGWAGYSVLMRQTSLWKPFMQTLIPLQTI
jgi:hypothetical protein